MSRWLGLLLLLLGACAPTGSACRSRSRTGRAGDCGGGSDDAAAGVATGDSGALAAGAVGWVDSAVADGDEQAAGDGAAQPRCTPAG
jgi:hypothetical protein